MQEIKKFLWGVKVWEWKMHEIREYLWKKMRPHMQSHEIMHEERKALEWQAWHDTWEEELFFVTYQFTTPRPLEPPLSSRCPRRRSGTWCCTGWTCCPRPSLRPSPRPPL